MYQSLNRFIVINAPAAFSAVWRIIRTFIDPRTATKVEIFASRKQVWQARLLELIDADHLPSDYGGTGPPTSEAFHKQTTDSDLRRQVIHPILVRSANTVLTQDVVLETDEVMELVVLTRSLKTGTFTVIQQSGAEEVVVQIVEVTHDSQGVDGEEPTRVTFPRVLNGPGKVGLL